MKRALLAVAALAIVGTVQAQTPSPAPSGFNFGILAGVTIPTGDLSNAASTGWHAGGLVNYTDPGWPIGVRIDAVYSQFGSKDLGDGVSNQPYDIRGTVNGVWMFPMDAGSTIRPYLIAGVGVYYLKDKVTCTDSEYCTNDSYSASSTKFGINGGAGIEMPLSSFSIFVEARYHDIFTDGGSTHVVPVSVGIVFR